MKTVLCLAAAIVTLGGCDVKSNPLWVVMAVDKSVVAMDDSVRVSLRLTNISDRDVMVHPASDYGSCHTGFEVFDEEGRPVYIYAVCALASMSLPSRVPLAPGESLDITSWWHPDISRVGDRPITLGVYQIRGAVVGDERLVHTGLFEVLVIE